MPTDPVDAALARLPVEPRWMRVVGASESRWLAGWDGDFDPDYIDQDALAAAVRFRAALADAGLTVGRFEQVKVEIIDYGEGLMIGGTEYHDQANLPPLYREAT